MSLLPAVPECTRGTGRRQRLEIRYRRELEKNLKRFQGPGGELNPQRQFRPMVRDRPGVPNVDSQTGKYATPSVHRKLPRTSFRSRLWTCLPRSGKTVSGSPRRCRLPSHRQRHAPDQGRRGDVGVAEGDQAKQQVVQGSRLHHHPLDQVHQMVGQPGQRPGHRRMRGHLVQPLLRIPFVRDPDTTDEFSLANVGGGDLATMICSSSWDCATMILFISSQRGPFEYRRGRPRGSPGKAESNPGSGQRNNEGPTA